MRFYRVTTAKIMENQMEKNVVTKLETCSGWWFVGIWASQNYGHPFWDLNSKHSSIWNPSWDPFIYRNYHFCAPQKISNRLGPSTLRNFMLDERSFEARCWTTYDRRKNNSSDGSVHERAAKGLQAESTFLRAFGGRAPDSGRCLSCLKFTVNFRTTYSEYYPYATLIGDCSRSSALSRRPQAMSFVEKHSLNA